MSNGKVAVCVRIDGILLTYLHRRVKEEFTTLTAYITRLVVEDMRRSTKEPTP